MISITKVERKGKSVQLTFSDSTTLKIIFDVYKKYNFVTGEQIDENFLEVLKSENDYLQAKISALRYLSIRNHSSNELRQKLSKKKFAQDIIEKVLSELNNQNYLDDKKFAEQFFNELLGKFFGPLKIKNEMLKRGIERKIIDDVVQNYFNDDNFQMNVILQYLSKNKFPKKIKSKKELQKIYNHLIGRGFLSASILQGLKEKYNWMNENVLDS